MRRQLAVALLFMGFAGAMLWTPIVHGGYFMASDIGQLWPLTHVAAGSGQPSNSLQSDVYTQLMPMMRFAVAQVHAGHLPTWNPYSGNGQPFLANYQSALFSPFTGFFYALGFRLALIASALSRLWLLGFFTFMFLRRHRLGDVASVVGGVVFMCAGYHVVWLNYPITSVSAWLPLALWCTKVMLDNRAGDEGAHRRRNVATAGLTASLAAMLLGGNPETATFDLILIVAYGAIALSVERVGWKAAGHAMVRFAVAGALAAGLAAVQLIPFARYEHISTAAQEHHAAIPGFNLSTVPMVALPDLFGGPQLSYYDGVFYTQYLHPQSNYAELDGNAVGLIALCIAPVGLAALRRRRREALPWFGAGAAVVGTLLLYSHAAGAVWEHVPILHAAYLNRSQDVELMGLAVLAALATDWVVRAVADWRAHPRHAKWALCVFAGAISAISVALVVWASILRDHVAGLPGNNTTTSVALSQVHRHVLTELALVLAFFIAVIAFATVRRSRRLRVLLALPVVVAVFASTGLVMRTYNPTVPAVRSYPLTLAVRQLKAVVGSSEVLFAGAAFPLPGTNLWFGIHDVGSYDAVGLRWHDDLYRRVFHTPDTRQERMPTCVEGLQLFGVRWVVGGNGQLGNGSTLTRAGLIEGIPYYAVPASSPYEVVTGRASVAGDAKALRLVSSCGFDPARAVVVDGGSTASSRSSTPGVSSGSVHRQSSSPSSIVLSTTSAKAGWLVVKESWAPGWRATVDGHAVSVERADAAFLGLRLASGHHVVRFTYGL